VVPTDRGNGTIVAGAAVATTIQILGDDVEIFTDAALGVAGRPWPAQEVAARAVRRFIPPLERCRTIVELGSGCGALAVALAGWFGSGRRIVATDLPEVLPLLKRNCHAASVRGVDTSGGNNGKTSSLDCHALRWGDLNQARAILAADVPLDSTSNASFDFDDQRQSICVVACEVAYWGGWDIFEEDTREPLVATLDYLIRGPEGIGILVHEVRDSARETSIFNMIRAHGLAVQRVQPPGQDEIVEGQVGVWVLRRHAISAETFGRGPE